jgi:hypothetical protein
MSTALKAKEVNTDGATPEDSDGESDEDKKGFVVASQYDPGPVSTIYQKWSLD